MSGWWGCLLHCRLLLHVRVLRLHSLLTASSPKPMLTSCGRGWGLGPAAGVHSLCLHACPSFRLAAMRLSTNGHPHPHLLLPQRPGHRRCRLG